MRKLLLFLLITLCMGCSKQSVEEEKSVAIVEPTEDKIARAESLLKDKYGTDFECSYVGEVTGLPRYDGSVELYRAVLAGGSDLFNVYIDADLTVYDTYASVLFGEEIAVQLEELLMGYQYEFVYEETEQVFETIDDFLASDCGYVVFDMPDSSDLTEADIALDSAGISYRKERYR